MFGALQPAAAGDVLPRLRRLALREVQAGADSAQAGAMLLDRQTKDRWHLQRQHWHNVATTFEAATADVPSVDEPALVVLLGRTQAGKSTLFQFLTGSTTSKVGEG